MKTSSHWDRIFNSRIEPKQVKLTVSLLQICWMSNNKNCSFDLNKIGILFVSKSYSFVSKAGHLLCLSLLMTWSKGSFLIGNIVDPITSMQVASKMSEIGVLSFLALFLALVNIKFFTTFSFLSCKCGLDS